MTDKQGDNSRTELAEGLNGLLADSYALFLKTKNFHWHVRGPHFREYHLMFDAQAQEIMATTDLIAERVRKLGKTTLRSIGDISKHQSLKDNDKENVSAEAMIKELRDDNLALVDTLKGLKDLCEQANDNATDGLIDDWTDQAEERAWFLSETLGKDL